MSREQLYVSDTGTGGMHTACRDKFHAQARGGCIRPILAGLLTASIVVVVVIVGAACAIKKDRMMTFR